MDDEGKRSLVGIILSCIRLCALSTGKWTDCSWACARKSSSRSRLAGGGELWCSQWWETGSRWQWVMRTKTFILLLTCFVITSSILILFSNQRPTIQNIVSETHKQLNNLKTLKVRLSGLAVTCRLGFEGYNFFPLICRRRTCRMFFRSSSLPIRKC